MSFVAHSDPFVEILQLLADAELAYELVEHEQVVTSQETVDVTGFDLAQGAKCIVFKSKQGFLLAVVRGDNRADFKKLKQHLQVSKIRLATPDEVLSVMRVPIGACYPFGGVAGIPMIADKTLQDAERVHFSPGTHVHHVRMKIDDFVAAADPQFVDIALDE